jgi:hypothetical protein
VAKNNLSYENGDNFYGTFSASSSNNLSGPTQTDAPGADAVNAATVTFVDESGFDLHLSASDGSARDAGLDLSADADLVVGDDIDSEVRSGMWEIGADQLP